jgi:serine/threonine protein kinase
VRPAEGTALGGGRYVLERHLGSGGMASVWLARDEALGRAVAIKLMADTLADDPRWLERFKREARAAAALSHPHIVKVFDFGIEEHRPYLVMAHVPGGSLRDRLRDGGAPPEAAGLARELLGALAHVHAAGIVHRDVKPGNVLLDEHDRAQLTDFGIARPQDATAMTQTGMVLGTARYLAPEVAEGAPATERSDLYAAGGVLREAGGEAAGLGALIGALTDPDPERRPASADDALAMLDADAPTRRLAPPAGATPAGPRGGASPAGPRAGGRGGAPPVRARGGAPPRSHGSASAALRRLDELIRRPWFPPAAGILAILALAVIVIALAGGGGEPEREPAAAPAPASAPLGEQLRGLDRAIDAAASRGR